ncbi:TIGR03769 domain-containing protein [Streptomyces sp. NPDC006976]|uniref:TIGR03769 domain-containing protein n=1 Tax=Streptomyces sp. NPDC006976 TaxID=3154311 RepID=UPI0033C77894
MVALTRGSRSPAVAVTAVCAAVFIGAAGLVAGGSGDARAAGGAAVIEEGELDLVPRIVDGALKLEIDDRGGGTPEVRAPSQVVVHAGPATKETVVGPAYPILGELVDAYFLNGFFNSGQIYSPEPVWKGGESGGGSEVGLTGFEGPGRFALYVYTPEMDSADEPAVPYLGSDADAPRSFTLSADEGGMKPTWAFTAEGVYRTTFTVSATLADGRTVRDTETLAWVVGNGTDPSAVVPGDGGEPASSPTATPTPSASEPTSAPSSTPSPPGASGSAGPEGGSATAAPSSAVVTGPAAGSGAVGAFNDPKPAGGLAATGSPAAVIAAIALAATAAGGGVFAAARRRRAVG